MKLTLGLYADREGGTSANEHVSPGNQQGSPWRPGESGDHFRGGARSALFFSLFFGWGDLPPPNNEAVRWFCPFASSAVTHPARQGARTAATGKPRPQAFPPTTTRAH